MCRTKISLGDPQNVMINHNSLKRIIFIISVIIISPVWFILLYINNFNVTNDAAILKSIDNAFNIIP